MLGDLEALRLGVYGAYHFDKRKGGKIWPLSIGLGRHNRPSPEQKSGNKFTSNP